MKKIRIALIIPTLAVLLCGAWLISQSHAQDESPQFDHVAVYVHDMQKSVEFYEKVMGLKRIPDPFKDGRHVFFRIGEHAQLHLVGGATAVMEHDINIHTAFRVASVPAFIAHLDKMHVPYRNFKGDGKVGTRVDGVTQVYIQDPDGYWIEVNDVNRG